MLRRIQSVAFAFAACCVLVFAGPAGDVPAADGAGGDRTASGPADRDQAYWSASRELDLAMPQVDFTAGAIAGIEALPAQQLRYTGVHGNRHFVRYRENPRYDEPVRVRLSKHVYPAEDGHLDALVWLTTPEAGRPPTGRLDLVLRDENGSERAREHITRLERFPAGLFFSMGLPPALTGRSGTLDITWMDGEEQVGSARAVFNVASASDAPVSGRIRLSIPNASAARMGNAPMTVGVPFPHGALRDEKQVRLLDEFGREVPLQTRVMARWSRFGPIKWLLCDFTSDLAGAGRFYDLEFGPDIRRGERGRATGGFGGCRRNRPASAARPVSIAVDAGAPGFPRIDAGRLKVGPEGIAYDVAGNGRHVPVLGKDALRGEYVLHEDGRRFVAPEGVAHEIEEQGSEKVVVRRTGWYRDPESGEEFCNFVTRLVFHRDSPLVRIYHTWIFTGDGNRDRIREMGWRFPLAGDVSPQGFLAGGDGDEWVRADALVQWNHEGFDVLRGGERETREQGRAPGVARARGAGAAVYFGVKDFWQNFPGELLFDEGAFWFQNWPRHNRPASFARPVEVGHAYRHRFAHEGELLDFRLPDEYGLVDGEISPIANAAMRIGRASSMHYDPENLESVNAQGIARTEEIFLYLAGPDEDPGAGARVMRGLNDETLRAIVDPAWMAASGVFGRIHRRDVEAYPEDERVYEEVCHAPSRWADRLEIYGKWIFGDIAAWTFDLHGRTAAPYRAYRKNHHGWPMRWIPFVRSGDPAMLKHAERAARQMMDANFCHYVSEAVNEAVGEHRERRQGWWTRGILPWAGKLQPTLRGYDVDCDYLWHHYYITGFRRPRDVALLWGARIPSDRSGPGEGMIGPNRGPQTTMISSLHMYQATFDPWFLMAVHAFADMYISAGGFHFDRWRPTAREYLEYTGCPEFEAMVSRHYDPPRPMPFPGNPNLAHHQQPAGGTTMMRIWPAVFGWRATGDPYYLRRAAHVLDWARAAVYEGDVDYFRGTYTGGETTRRTGPGLFTGWYIQQFPLALGAFEEAGFRPDPIPTFFTQPGVRDILIRKEDGEPVLLLLRAGGGPSGGEYRLSVENAGGREVFSESWPVGERRETELPAELPAGTYQLTVDNARTLTMPVAPPDVPEVFRLTGAPAGTRVAGGRDVRKGQYWFRVPDEAPDFRVVFYPPDEHAARMTVWNPDGERAWDRSYFSPVDGDGPVEAVVEVDAGHAGRIWRITKPGWDNGFQLDPRIPPVFSVSRDKWFDPTKHGWPGGE